MMIKNHSKKTIKSIIVLKNNDKKLSKKDNDNYKIIIPRNNNVKLSKKDNNDDKIIISRNDDVKSSFLDDNESLFQGTISFLLKQLEPAQAKP